VHFIIRLFLHDTAVGSRPDPLEQAARPFRDHHMKLWGSACLLRSQIARHDRSRSGAHGPTGLADPDNGLLWPIRDNGDTHIGGVCCDYRV